MARLSLISEQAVGILHSAGAVWLGGKETAGVLKEMERLFSPVRQLRPERAGPSSEMDGRGRGGMQERSEGLCYSSLSSTSLSSGGSGEEGGPIALRRQPEARRHSRSCADLRGPRESGGAAAPTDHRRCRHGHRRRLAYSRFSSRSEDELSAEEAAENPASPRPPQRPARPPGRGARRDRQASDKLRKAKSMEVILPRGLGAKGRATPGEGRNRRGQAKASGAIAVAIGRLVQQKVKFSQFLDDITLQVLSPVNLTSLNQKAQEQATGQGARGKGQAGEQFNVKAGVPQEGAGGTAWQEEEGAPGQPRWESGGTSASPEIGPLPASHLARAANAADPTASPEGGSRHPPRPERLRQALGTRAGEQGPAPGKQSPSAERRQPRPTAGPCPDMAQGPEMPGPGAAPPAYRRRRAGRVLTDSASSLESGPALGPAQEKGGPRGYTDSSSKPEESLAAEGPPHPVSSTRDTDTHNGQELLTDTHRLRFLHENEDLQRRLACATYRMEKMDSEFKADHGYLETELGRVQAEIEDLRVKFWRLHESYSSTQRANELMENKLYTIAQNMETERTSLNQRISELTNKLTAAQNTISSLEQINPAHLLPALLPETAAHDGCDLLGTTFAPAPFPAVSPPEAFQDEGPEAEAGVRQPTSSAGGGGAGEGEAPEQVCPPAGPSAFAPWTADTLGATAVGDGYGEPSADGGKADVRHPVSCHAADPFGPEVGLAPVATGDGRGQVVRRHETGGDPSPRGPWGQAGKSDDDAGWSQSSVGKAAGLGYRALLLSNLAAALLGDAGGRDATGCPPGPGSAAAGCHSLALGPGQRLPAEGEWSHLDGAVWGGGEDWRPTGAPGGLGVEPAAMGRVRASLAHRPPTAPRKHRGPAVHRPASSDQTF